MSLNVSSYWPCEWCADANTVKQTVQVAARLKRNRMPASSQKTSQFLVARFARSDASGESCHQTMSGIQLFLHGVNLCSGSMLHAECEWRTTPRAHNMPKHTADYLTTLDRGL